MAKKAVMITIDESTWKKAKQQHINISQACESALYKKVYQTIDMLDEEKECSKCKAKGTELIWFCPDEKWICNKCLKQEVNKVIIGVVPS